MKRWLAFALPLTLVSVAMAATGTRPDADPRLESLRASTPVAAAASGEAPRVILGDEIDSALEELAHGAEQVIKTRVFSKGHLSEPGDLAEGIRWDRALLDPVDRSLLALGTIDDSTVVADIRTVRFDNRHYVMRDIYLDGPAADLSVGRGIPFLLEAHATRAAAAPTINSLAGNTIDVSGIVNGKAQMQCGRNYNGSVVINDEPGVLPLTINGTNFGSKPGSVKLTTATVPLLTASSWTDTRIVADPTLASGSGGMSSVLTVKTLAGASATYGISVAPAIKTRVFGQCTWYVAARRISLRKSPSPTAYGSYSSIDGNWVPQVGDQLKWETATTKHTAIITAVAKPVTQAGGYTTYSTTIEEQNADCNNSLNKYSSDFQIQTVSGRNKVTKYLKSSVRSLGDAISYYR